jgi:hypothetical protein
MLADGLDGTLSAVDQAEFDRHAAGCELCGQMVADAQRGAAWLQMLRDPAPEPPADLLERILAQTIGSQLPAGAGTVVAGAMHPAGIASMPYPAAAGTVLPFPRRAYSAVRRSGFGQIVLQPRLAMTAAMAFFSIALTMNITGIHTTSLRASDLAPSSLRRDFFSANARVVQYYQGLRVVYELESRVRDLQNAQDTNDDAQPGGQAPASQPSTQPAPANPGTAPSGNQPGSNRSTPPAAPGTSRREDLNPVRRLTVAEHLGPASPGIHRHARTERKLV